MSAMGHFRTHAAQYDPLGDLADHTLARVSARHIGDLALEGRDAYPLDEKQRYAINRGNAEKLFPRLTTP